MTDDDLRTLRARVRALEVAQEADASAPYGTPSMLGRVVDGGSKPTALPGQFLMERVRAAHLLAEGAAAGFATMGTGRFIATVVGTQAPDVGEVLVCYGGGGRWFAERLGSAGPQTITIPNCDGSASTCFGVSPPSLTLAIHTAGGVAFYPDTLSWGSPPFLDPSGGGPLDDPSMYGTVQTATDGSGDKRYYRFGCTGGAWGLWSCAFRIDTDTGDYFFFSESLFYHWIPGFPGNTCTPFSLHNGGSFLGDGTVLYLDG